MKNIILTGFMGCGKTSVGKYLAEVLGCEFLDTDAWIEQQQGRSVSEIFAAEGENAFREMETQCLRKLLERKEQGFVLSTGGGMPIRERNRKLLKELGDVFYLQADADLIYKRLRNDKTRPLLQDKNPRGRIQDLMNARKSCYEEADYIVTVGNRTVEEIAEMILKISGRK